MTNILKSLAQRTTTAVALGLITTQTALAQVNFPTFEGGVEVNDNDLFATLKSIAVEGFTLLLTIAGIAAFAIVAWSAISKFNECRAGRAEWAEVAVTAGMGVLILVVVSVLFGLADENFLSAAAGGGNGGGGTQGI